MFAIREYIRQAKIYNYCQFAAPIICFLKSGDGNCISAEGTPKILKGNTKDITKATVENASCRASMTEELNGHFHMRYPQKKDGDENISIVQKKIIVQSLIKR